MNKKSYPKLHSIKFKTGPFVDDVIFSSEFKCPDHLPAINILEGAILQNLQDVVLIGYGPDGSEYIATTMLNVKEASFMFGRGQLSMLLSKGHR